VDVELAFERTQVEGEAGGVIETIRSRVKLYGAFDEAQRNRLVQVAQRCPMHRTLARGLTMEDSVEFAAEVA
jgi:putative redox protein